MSHPLTINSFSPACKQRLRVACMCIASFVCGFWVGICRTEHRATALSLERFHEFLSIADQFDIIDHARLEEAIIIMSEAEWEDRDAEQNAGRQ